MALSYAHCISISIVLVVFLFQYASGQLCPKQCDCDMDTDGLNRASCVDQAIVDINVGVPNSVQVYSLSHNVISELDNYCFKEANYLSLVVLNLSNNLIFWIGLHAFSGMQKLNHLDLSYNRLRYIPSDLFWDTPQLTTLDLSSNIFESLKNEPFLMHPKLEILNLNNCRIKAFPERLFTRLPNLKKLDLSENYVLTFNVQVLVPMHKLERLELRNVYWKCNADFMAIESWITDRGITYQKQCVKISPKMSEKMISVVTVEKEDVYVDDVWNITAPKNDSTPATDTRPLTPFQKFDREFSSFQAFVIGLELGLAFGVVGTYIWLRKFCHCGQLSCTRPQVRRRRTRMRGQRDGDMRASLLWNNVISPDPDSPPFFRRQHSLPERGAPVYGVPVVSELALQVDAVRLQARGETPPPPYHECRVNM